MSEPRKSLVRNFKAEDAASLPPLRPGDDAVVAAFMEKRKQKARAPLVKIDMSNGVATTTVGESGHAVDLMKAMLAVGTADDTFFNGLMSGIINAAKTGGKVTEADVNFIVSFVCGVEPHDEVEALLAVQMVAIHNATIATARRFAHVDNIAQLEVQERTLNKLARTFTTQVEALKRYRTGGQQNVVVKHVTVNEGGQAIVGAVTHVGGGPTKKSEATS